MNTFTRFCCFTLLLIPSMVLGNNLYKDVFVYIHDQDHYWNHHYPTENRKENQIVFRVEQERGIETFQQEIDEDQQWYHFEIPAQYIDQINSFMYKGKKVMCKLPVGNSPIYITILNEKLLPHGVKVFDEKSIRTFTHPHRIRIKGEIAIDPEKKIPAHIGLHLPLDDWQDQNHIHKSAAEAEIDWRYATFNFQYKSIFPTIGFVSFDNRYYPIFLEPGDEFKLRWDIDSLTQKWKRVRCCNNRHHHRANAREFFRQRYEFGLSRDEYRDLANAFIGNKINRQDTLIAWSRAIVPFYKKGHNNPDRILSYINQIGKHSHEDVFEEAYDRYNNIQGQIVRLRYSQAEGFLLLGLLATLFIFAIIIFIRLIGKKALQEKYVNWVEGGLFGFVVANILFHALISTRYGGYAEIANASSWALLLGTLLVFYVNMRYLVPEFLIKKQWIKYLGAIAGISIVVFFASAFIHMMPFDNYNVFYIEGSYRLIPHHGGRVGPGIDEIGPIHVLLLFIAPVYGLGRHLIFNRVPKLQQQKVALNAELNTLKSQVSPHFFFNSLNTVYGFALGEDSPKTAEAITKLSDLMRFAIYHGREDYIALEKELDYLSDYIELQRLRLNPVRHIVKYRVDGEPGDLQIAPLLLITLIENAFKHGVSMSKDSFIHIDLFIQTDGLILTVENSVHPGQLQKVGEGEVKESGVGLANTQQRLDLLYTGRYEWHVEEEEGKYLTQLSLDLR